MDYGRRRLADALREGLVMRRVRVDSRLALIALFGTYSLLIQAGDVKAQQTPPPCTVAECAQQAAAAAARAEAAVKALEQKLEAATNFVVTGNRVRCDIPWRDGPPTEATTSFAICPATSRLLSGGCDMTCLSMDHLSSIPSPPGETPRDGNAVTLRNPVLCLMTT
jgi:hypothetical protein